MKKRLLTILIGIIVLLSASCAAQPEEEFSMEFGTEFDSIDMDGFKFGIMQGYDETILFQYKADTLAFDLVKRRFNEIENKYNCKIEVESIASDGGYLSSVVTRLMAGTYSGELAFSHQPYQITHSGVLYPLDPLVEYLDCFNAEKYGSLEMRGFSIDNNSVFTVSPVLWPGKQVSYAYAFFAVNEQIIKKNVLTDPREYVEGGTWYWDKFEEILPLYTIVEGDEKVTSVNFTWNFPLDFAASNGYTYVDETLSSNNLKSPAVAEALDFLSRICVEYRDNITYDDHYTMVDNFIAQKYVLAQTSFAHMVNEIIFDVDDYGVVPVPCGPKGQYGKWGGYVSDYDSFGIFYNAKEPEVSAMILADILEPLDGYETKDDLFSYAKSIFYDDADAELFLSYTDNIRYNFWNEGVYANFNSMISMVKTGKSSSEIIGKYETPLQTAIENNVLPDYKFIMANKK